jgi:hypothetical protein
MSDSTTQSWPQQRHLVTAIASSVDFPADNQKLVQVRGKLRLDRSIVSTSIPGSLIGFALQPGVPDQRLGSIVRFAGHERFLPVARFIFHHREMTHSVVPRLCSGLAATTEGASLLSGSPFGLGLSLGIAAQRSAVQRRGLNRSRLFAGHRVAVSRRRQTDRRNFTKVSASSDSFRHWNGGSRAFAFLALPDPLKRPFA